MAYQVTGNDYLSLPTIRENDGAVEGVTFLYMQAKGLLEIRGKDGLIRPYVELDGQRLPLCPSSRRNGLSASPAPISPPWVNGRWFSGCPFRIRMPNPAPSVSARTVSGIRRCTRSTRPRN